MKYLNYLFWVLFFLLFFNGLIISQNYVPFPNSNIIWNVITTNTFTYHSPYKYRYGIIGDTLINDTLFSKLYVLENDTNLNVSNGSYVGAIRENDKQIYYRDISFPSKDILLYDFSLQEGDTMFYDYYGTFGNIEQYINPHYSVVNTIDSVLINNKYRKRFQFECCDTWIEGMGSLLGYGFIHPIAEYPLNGDEVTVACIKYNDTILYMENPLCDKCFCTLSSDIKKTKNEKILLSVSPNPVTSFFVIQFDYKKEEVYKLILIDCEGKVVLIKNNINNSNILINKGNLNSGLYFVIIKNDKGQIYSEKIIIE